MRTFLKQFKPSDAKAYTQHMNSIDLSNCPGIIDRALQYLSHCRKLKYASFANDHKITSAGVSALAEGCKFLRVLNLERCVNVGDDGIVSLGE